MAKKSRHRRAIERGKNLIEASSPKIKLDLSDAVKQEMPLHIDPMLATEMRNPFDSDAHIFEFKLDGYRTIAFVNNNFVQLKSRNGKSFNNYFNEILDDLKDLPDVILDGEMVVLEDNGKPSFSLLENYKKTKQGKLVYYVFDILFFNGYSLQPLPLLRRKEILKEVIKDKSKIRYCDHVEDEGIEFFEVVRKNELEGIVAKEKNSSYKEGFRSPKWIKIPVKDVLEAVVIGYTIPKSANFFGSLVLAKYDNSGELKYIGSSGGAFSEKEKLEIFRKLEQIKMLYPPIANIEKEIISRGVQWVEPKIICEVEYKEVTKGGRLRLPVFKRIRWEKEYPGKKEKNEGIKIAAEVATPVKRAKNEVEDEYKKDFIDDDKAIVKVANKKIFFTSLKEKYFLEGGLIKGDLLDYYHKASKIILPFLKDRPITIASFIEPRRMIGDLYSLRTSVKGEIPKWIKTIELVTGNPNKTLPYLLCSDEAHLLYFIQLGFVQFGCWNSRKSLIENPDYIVLELEPLKIKYRWVVEVAMYAKELFDTYKIPSFIKTYRNDGLQIYIPMGAKYNQAECKVFAEILAYKIHLRIPELSSLESNPEKRVGDVFIDFAQNGLAQFAIAAYSLTTIPEAAVSSPISWEELKDIHPSDFTVNNIFQRTNSWKEFYDGIMGRSVDLQKILSELR